MVSMSISGIKEIQGSGRGALRACRESRWMIAGSPEETGFHYSKWRSSNFMPNPTVDRPRCTVWRTLGARLFFIQILFCHRR